MNNSLSKRIQRVKLTIANRGLHMNPRLKKGKITSFEKRYRIELPLDYRLFLMEIGNGGAGPPYYGLMRLGEVPDNYDKSADEVLESLHKPFPLTQYWVWEGEQEPKPELHEAINRGNLVLGADGCAMYWLLIVTGAERGQIWNRADVGIQPCAPPRGFLSWYEYWLGGGEDWWADVTP